MTSVRNHRPLLSGNKWLLFLGIALLAGACSPKLQPVAPLVKTETEKPAVKTEPVKTMKPLPPKTASIALLLPFALDNLNPGAVYTEVGLEQANLSLDYYQGFKLALDSLTGLGYNYKLQVFDTKGMALQARSLANDAKVRTSDLIVGPVFPEDVRAFAPAMASLHKPILSPLSPANPSTIKSPTLITAIPPLAYHAQAAAKYINGSIKPKKVFILTSGFSEENEYISSFKKMMDSLSKCRTSVVQLTVSRGKLNTLVPQLSAGSDNVFVIPSTRQDFLTITLHSLDSLAKKYPVMLFGHPSWIKFSFLRADMLQRLKTHITSADRVDYKTPATLAFFRAYRNAYHIEPGEYAIKGFDEGLYFGTLLGEGKGELKNIDQKDFTGIHNGFHFINKPGLGYININI